MPLPKPTQTENRESFIERCITDPVMNEEFTSLEQIRAVCIRQWENKNKFLNKQNMKYKFLKDFKKIKDHFKNKKKETPVLVNKAKIDSDYKITLTAEIYDRENEMVKIDGLKLPESKSVPMIDSHNMNGSVVDNVLGRIEKLEIVNESGVKKLQGYAKFANTQRGREAKLLVEGGFVDTVSIGFAVFDYDNENGIIKESELYEGSLVSVPANPLAVIEKNDLDIKTVVKNYDNYKKVIKEYRCLFSSKLLCDKLGYEKTGEELVDIKNVFDLILESLSKAENQSLKSNKAENQFITREDAKSAIEAFLKQK